MLWVMSTPVPQRARSAAAKQQREQAILDAARSLGAERSVREVTLTDIAAAVGMHKSAMLRYFETREQIFLALTAEGWREWSAELRARTGSSATVTPRRSPPSSRARWSRGRSSAICSLRQAPLNLERNVSLEAAYAFKTVALGEVAALTTELCRLFAIGERAAVDVIATATSMAGALWQMAAPGTRLRELYEARPELAHALVDVEPQLTRILAALLKGLCATPTNR